MANFLRTMIHWQVWLSERFDGMLPAKFQQDGNEDYRENLVPLYLRHGLRLYEVGGGKSPLIDADVKQSYALHIIGIDIDQEELDRAQPGLYDETICADITTFQGQGDGDMIICQTLLEHVQDTEATIGAIAGILKPGGMALLFVPSRNALFARLNILLPHDLKRRILFGIYPERAVKQGFRAYYHRCTPRAMVQIASSLGLAVKELRTYYISHYFYFCFPLHLLWRLWLFLFYALAGKQAAETFSLVLVKPERAPAGIGAATSVSDHIDAGERGV